MVCTQGTPETGCCLAKPTLPRMGPRSSGYRLAPRANELPDRGVVALSSSREACGGGEASTGSGARPSQLPEPPTPGSEHSQHPAIQLPPHYHPKGLLGELHAVQRGWRPAADTRGLHGHLVASAGGVFNLDKNGGVMQPLLGRQLCLHLPTPSFALRGAGGPFSLSTAGQSRSLGAVAALPELQFPHLQSRRHTCRGGR